MAADLDWDTVILLPGLAASGGALLFGVNAWCLDARGALWRESLPVSAGLAFTVRATVLLELLLAASAVSVLLGAVRAGVPTLSQALALVCIWVVAALMVVSASMRWSLRKPYAVDLRSARATPAPPGVMVGYSGRLALATTLVSMLFSGLAVLPWPFSLAVRAAVRAGLAVPPAPGPPRLGGPVRAVPRGRDGGRVAPTGRSPRAARCRR